MNDVEVFALKFSGQPYKYGYHDCFKMCLRWVDQNNKTNFLSQYEYHDLESGLAMMKDNRALFVFDIFDKHFKKTNNPKAGDLVAWSENKYGACGIIAGVDKFLSVPVQGGIDYTKQKYVKAWSLNE